MEALGPAHAGPIWGSASLDPLLLDPLSLDPQFQGWGSTGTAGDLTILRGLTFEDLTICCFSPSDFNEPYRSFAVGEHTIILYQGYM